tara:strand:- start:7 stop:879 length:873 start_codon:yes stop_codon:yes gene_type:complete
MINLVWLKTFCTLADVGHFTQTAEMLFMTQSGVSQHIKKLEQHLDTLLLIREGKSFSLTDAGLKLRQQGQALLKTSDEIEDSIKQNDPLIGTVKLASPGSIGLKLYPYLLDIQQCHPTLIIDYIFAPNKNIEQDLLERKIAIGLLTMLSNNPQLISEKIAIEPLVLVTSNNVKSIDWQALSSLGFISHPDAEHHAQLLLSKNFPEFEHINQFVHKGFSNQISLILEPVSRGLGFTVLPLHAVNAFHQQEKINIHALKYSVSEPLYLCQNKHSFENNRSKYVKASIRDFIV